MTSGNNKREYPWLSILGDNTQVAIEVHEHFEYVKANINCDSNEFKHWAHNKLSTINSSCFDKENKPNYG